MVRTNLQKNQHVTLFHLTSFTPTSPCIGWCWDAHGHLEEVGDLLWKPLKEESQFFSQVSLQITIE